MAYWVTKARPKRAPKAADMRAGERDTWDTAKPPADAAAGDRLFFYAASPGSRVIGLGTLVRWRRELNQEGRHQFDVRYLVDRLPAGPRLVDLRADPALSGASFTRSGISSTLYPLSDEQGRRLFEIVAEHEPAVAGVWPDLDAPELPDVDLDAAAAVEGRASLASHLRYERRRSLVEQKRKAVLARTGRLACEVCGFDFSAAYGCYGEGFCEVHHTRPIADGERRTRLRDLAILCSNCHRVVHRTSPMLSVAELRSAVRAA